MNWRALDLNLLFVLDAVAQERSVTRAASKLKLSQSAISHALGRLRKALGDQLFIRTPEGMEPTPYTDRISGPVRTALEGLRMALTGPAEFDPATAERSFTVAVDNRAALVVGAALAAMVAREAPSITLDLRPSGTSDVTERLDRGDLDLALGALAAPGERFADLRLFESGSAALVRRGHPGITNGTIELDALASFPHLILSSTGEETDFVDAGLERHGLARRISLRAPLLTAAAALSGSDMVAVMNIDAAQAFASTAALEVLQLPFTSPRLPTMMLWHRRQDEVEAHKWLRNIVEKLPRSL